MEVHGLSAGIYDYDGAAAGVQPVLYLFFYLGVTVIWRYDLDRDIGRALGKAVGLANLSEPFVGYECEVWGENMVGIRGQYVAGVGDIGFTPRRFDLAYPPSEICSIRGTFPLGLSGVQSLPQLSPDEFVAEAVIGQVQEFFGCHRPGCGLHGAKPPGRESLIFRRRHRVLAWLPPLPHELWRGRTVLRGIDCRTR